MLHRGSYLPFCQQRYPLSVRQVVGIVMAEGRESLGKEKTAAWVSELSCLSWVRVTVSLCDWLHSQPSPSPSGWETQSAATRRSHQWAVSQLHSQPSRPVLWDLAAGSSDLRHCTVIFTTHNTELCSSIISLQPSSHSCYISLCVVWYGVSYISVGSTHT